MHKEIIQTMVGKELAEPTKRSGRGGAAMPLAELRIS